VHRVTGFDNKTTHRGRYFCNGIVHFSDASWIARQTTFFTGLPGENASRFLNAWRMMLLGDSRVTVAQIALLILAG
jgi:hypothetical protein